MQKRDSETEIHFSLKITTFDLSSFTIDPSEIIVRYCSFMENSMT